MKEDLAIYKSSITHGLKYLTYELLEDALDVLSKCNTVYVGGNGGSAAISNHLVCDFSKGPYLKTHSLSCNTPYITAIANDISYEDTLTYQLERSLSSNDVLLLISSSGKSPNIVKAARYAKSQRVPLIGLTGFGGGELKELSDINFHFPYFNYGVVEDLHQITMHNISQQMQGRIQCQNL